MLFQLLTADELYAVLRPARAIRTTGGPSRARSPTTWTGPATGRRCRRSCTPGCWPAATGARRGTTSCEALESDIADVQGGTTGEGIHLGAMAGTVDLLERGFTGLETRRRRARPRPVPARRAGAHAVPAALPAAHRDRRGHRPRDRHGRRARAAGSTVLPAPRARRGVPPRPARQPCRSRSAVAATDRAPRSGGPLVRASRDR